MRIFLVFLRCNYLSFGSSRLLSATKVTISATHYESPGKPDRLRVICNQHSVLSYFAKEQNLENAEINYTG